MALPDAMTRVATLTAKAQTALTNDSDFLALPHPVTQQQALDQIDRLTRQNRAIIMLLLGQVDDLSGT